MLVKPQQQLWYEFLVSLAIIFGALFCILPLEGFVFKWWKDHAMLLSLLYLGAGMLFFVFSSIRLTMVSFAACTALCLFLNERIQSPLANPQPTDDPVFRIIQFKLEDNAQDELLSVLRIEADLISVQGVPQSQVGQVNDLFTCCGYPYFHCTIDTSSRHAITVYSKHPFKDVKSLYYPNTSGIAGVVQFSGDGIQEDFHFFTSFFETIDNAKTYATAQESVKTFAHQLKRIEQPLFVFGHYGFVPWSSEIQFLKQHSELTDSRRFLKPSFPHGYISVFNQPLDHILYSNHFKCISFETISSSTNPQVGIVGAFQFKNQAVVNYVEAKYQEL